GHPSTLAARFQIVTTYINAGMYAPAEPLAREQLALTDRGTWNPVLGGRMATLGMILVKEGKWTEAESILRECLELRTKREPDDWTTSTTRSLLGASLLGQKKYAEAEPLLVSGYEGMRVREATIGSLGKVRLPDAGERIVELYESWGKPGKSTEWRA